MQGTGQVIHWLDYSPLVLSLGTNPARLHGAAWPPGAAARECQELRWLGLAQPVDRSSSFSSSAGTDIGAPRSVPTHPGLEVGVIIKALWLGREAGGAEQVQGAMISCLCL